MLAFSKLLALAALVSAAAAGMFFIAYFSAAQILTSYLAPSGDEPSDITPATPGASLYLTSNRLDASRSPTDSQKILSTARIVDQKRGANDRSSPGLPAPKTPITAIDGKLTKFGFSSASQNLDNTTVFKRAHSAYDQVFAGTGTGFNDRDASIMGTAFLTYTVVSNATYDVDACLDFCDRVTGCGMFQALHLENLLC